MKCVRFSTKHDKTTSWKYDYKSVMIKCPLVCDEVYHWITFIVLLLSIQLYIVLRFRIYTVLTPKFHTCSNANLSTSNLHLVFATKFSYLVGFSLRTAQLFISGQQNGEKTKEQVFVQCFLHEYGLEKYVLQRCRS